MNTEIISRDDMNFLVQQSTGNLNMILSGMTSLMNDTDNKISMLEKQTWFQRMCKTISGQNKMTKNEIQNNHEKINVYMSQAIAELFEQQCIDRQVMISLGNRVNEIYESQIELKQMLGEFVVKLNQKIESIDNFHMLTEEINQGVYSIYKPFAAISKIMSQLDIRTINDERKMEILVRAMENAEIITNKEVPFALILEDLLYISESDAGILSLLYGNMQGDFIADIIEDTIFSYYLLPENVRKMKNRKSIIENVLKNHEIDMDYCISTHELYASLIEAYVNSIIQVSLTQTENQYDALIEYLDKCEEVIWYTVEMCKTWVPKKGEEYYPSQGKDYINFMNNVMNNLSKDSYLRSILEENLSNITNFIKFALSHYPELKDIYVCYTEYDVDRDDDVRIVEGFTLFKNNGSLRWITERDENDNVVSFKDYTLRSLLDLYESSLKRLNPTLALNNEFKVDKYTTNVWILPNCFKGYCILDWAKKDDEDDEDKCSFKLIYIVF